MTPSRWFVVVVIVSGVLATGANVRAQDRALRLPDGQLIGRIQTPVLPENWIPIPDSSSATRFQTSLWKAGSKGSLAVDFAEPLATPRQEPSKRSFRVTELELETSSGTPFVKLYCPEVDLIAEGKSAGTFVVRAYLGRSRVVFEGSTHTRPRPPGWGDCPTRITDDENVPAHYVRAQPGAGARARLVGEVYWNRGTGCERWVFRHSATKANQSDGTQRSVLLTRSIRKAYPYGGLREETFTYPIAGDPKDELLMQSRGVSSRWIREPHFPKGMGGFPGVSAIGWISTVQIVRASPQAITWIWDTTPDPVAYHPADSQTWFRNLASCEAERLRADK